MENQPHEQGVTPAAVANKVAMVRICKSCSVMWVSLLASLTVIAVLAVAAQMLATNSPGYNAMRDRQVCAQLQKRLAAYPVKIEILRVTNQRQEGVLTQESKWRQDVNPAGPFDFVFGEALTMNSGSFPDVGGGVL